MKTAREQIRDAGRLGLVGEEYILRYYVDIEVYCAAHTIGIDLFVWRMIYLMTHTNAGPRKAMRLVKKEYPN